MHASDAHTSTQAQDAHILYYTPDVALAAAVSAVKVMSAVGRSQEEHHIAS